MGKRLHFNHEARRLLQAGVDELANTVKVTLVAVAGLVPARTAMLEGVKEVMVRGAAPTQLMGSSAKAFRSIRRKAAPLPSGADGQGAESL